MKKVKFIYNPYSGENSIVEDLDKVFAIHQSYGYRVFPYRLSYESIAENAFEDDTDIYDYVLIAGGDGTVDTIVNIMKNQGIDIPIAILPMGTANDFAKFIGMPLKIEAALHKILQSKPCKVDLGKINDKYFINVASTGLFTDVSQKTDVNLKNTIGKLAYYVKGIEQIPNFRSIRIDVKSEAMNFDGDMYLMLVFNGQTAGNFSLAYKARIDDGLLDVIIIKAGKLNDMIALFFNMVKLEHLENDTGLIYFKTNKITVNCSEDIVTDIDGERGPDFPVTIECIKDGLEVLGIENN